MAVILVEMGHERLVLGGRDGRLYILEEFKVSSLALSQICLDSSNSKNLSKNSVKY